VEELIKMYLEDTIEDVVEVTENEEVIKQEPILSEEDANLSARRRAHHGSTRRRRHRDRVTDGDGDGDGDGGANEDSRGATIDQLDFVGELNGSAVSSPSTEHENAASSSNNASNGGGISFGDNEVRTFETDSSERKNEYMTHDADAADVGDDDDDDMNGRLNIGGDIRLDTMDIHTLNDIHELNAPPLLDDIEVLA
jgi:hypothetical protein